MKNLMVVCERAFSGPTLEEGPSLSGLQYPSTPRLLTLSLWGAVETRPVLLHPTLVPISVGGLPCTPPWEHPEKAFRRAAAQRRKQHRGPAW